MNFCSKRISWTIFKETIIKIWYIFLLFSGWLGGSIAVPRRNARRRVVRRRHRQLGHQMRAPAPPRRLRVRAALCSVDPRADAQVLGLTAPTARAQKGPALNSPPAFRSALAVPPLLVGGGRSQKHRTKMMVSTSSRRICCVFFSAFLRRSAWRTRPLEVAVCRPPPHLDLRSGFSCQRKILKCRFLEVLVI